MLLDRIIHISAALLELQSWVGNSATTYQTQLWNFISMSQLKKNIDCTIQDFLIKFSVK